MARSQLKPFQYEPLSTEPPQIRLLKLEDLSDSRESGVKLDQGRWQLTNVDLQDGIPYHALSYTWGCPYGEREPQSSEPSSVDWKSHSGELIINNQIFPIHPNLYLFFENCQIENTAEFIWVDAICIDQCNCSEKDYQIGKMGDIYSRAKFVTIWLGPGDVGTDRVFDIVRKLPQDLGSYDASVFSIPKAELRYGPVVSCLPESLQSRVFESLLALCRKSYWDRLWVMQEILLAPKLRVKCGKLVAFWANFATLVVELRTSSWFADHDDFTLQDGTAAWFISVRQENQRYQKTHQNQEMDRNFEGLLRKSYSSKCESPLDRIYGLLGLITNGHEFKVDSTIDIYTLFLRTIHFFQPRDLFSFCNTIARTLGLPMDTRGFYRISPKERSESLIAQRGTFSLEVQLDYVGTVDTDGLQFSSAYSLSSFEKLSYLDKTIPCYLCKSPDCRDLIGPQASLRIYQIPNTEVLLAYSDTNPARFMAVANRHNTYLDGAATVSLHRVGITFPSLRSTCPSDRELHPSSSLTNSCSIDLDYSAFEVIWSRTYINPGVETGYQMTKQRKWLLESDHFIRDKSYITSVLHR